MSATKSALTRTPGLGLWIGWVIANLLIPGVQMVMPNLAKMPDTSNLDPTDQAALSAALSSMLSAGIVLFGLSVVAFLVQWGVLRAHLSGFSLWRWFLAVIGGVVFTIVVELIVDAAAFGFIYRDSIQASMSDRDVVQAFTGNPLILFITQILTAACLAYTQGRTIRRYLGNVPMGTWLLANFAGALLSQSLLTYGRGVGTTPPGLHLADPVLNLLAAAVFAAVSGLGLLGMMRTPPYEESQPTYSFS
jgi:hypothetical protein